MTSIAAEMKSDGYRPSLNDVSDRLEELARKADLLMLAIQGVMANEGNDGLWPLQDAASEIEHAISEIAKEVGEHGAADA